MNRETEFKLQAYVDGELSRGEARRLAAWLQDHPDAQALVNELRMTHGFLSGNEPEVKLPESREFYWNKIDWAIERTEQSREHWAWELLHAWRKFLVPLAGTALVILLALLIPRSGESLRNLAEVENLSEDTGSFSFRSHADNMFVVWVYEKHPNGDPEAETFNEDDVIVQ